MHIIENSSTKLSNQQKFVHEKAFRNRLLDGSVEMWLNNDNLDYWGNTLPWGSLKKTFSNLGKKRILTIGDGKGGKDAVFFQELGHKVVASDIATDVLEEAKKRGIIKEFLQIDAENMALEESSFDIVVTKETLHHLPRPYLALYEMLRIAKEGVVLIEPKQNENIKSSDHPPSKAYEKSGNYIFRFSIYELINIARAYGAKNIAYHFSSIIHVPNAGDIKGEELEQAIEKHTKILEEQDAAKGLSQRGLINFLIWKEKMSDELAATLKRDGYKVVDLTLDDEVSDSIQNYLKSFD